ncbi:MAG: hypothetical protein U0516_04095 [Candidatus Saccharibacteria bacterium]
MSNYHLFIDNTSAENEALLTYLKDWASKLSVSAEFHVVEDFTTIGTILRQQAEPASAYICVGKQDTFSALLSYAKLLEDNAVIGYIPLTKNALAQKLGLKNHKDACKAIAQRKLFEITLCSINQYFMLFDYQLKITDMPEDGTTQFFIDKKLQIKSPTGSVKLLNKQFDSMHPSKSLVIEGYEQHELETESAPILQNLAIKNSRTQSTQLQFRLPFKVAQIESSGSIHDPFGTVLKKPVSIGLHSKKLRLIVKRGFELTQDQGDKLLSTEES